MSLIKSWRSNCTAEGPYKHRRPITLHILVRREGVAIMHWGRGRARREGNGSFVFIWISSLKVCLQFKTQNKTLCCELLVCFPDADPAVPTFMMQGQSIWKEHRIVRCEGKLLPLGRHPKDLKVETWTDILECACFSSIYNCKKWKQLKCPSPVNG